MTDKKQTIRKLRDKIKRQISDIEKTTHENEQGKEAYCNFCGCLESESHTLLAGFGANICDECIKYGYKIITEGE